LFRIAAILLLVSAAGAYGEIYSWTDAEGRVHFTEDLSAVPLQQREAAVERRPRESSRGGLSTFSSGTRDGISAATPRDPSSGARPVYQIPIERMGTALLVHARVNDELSLPFLVDTGASDVSLPRWAAERLGLDPAGNGRTREYVTANGPVEETALMLRSVELGGARVENVPAAIASSMDVGLLGLSFFNHFSIHVDSARGVLLLRPNDLADSGQILAGRSEAQWRAEYANLRVRIARVDAEAGRTNPNQTSKLEALEENRQDLLRQLDLLDAEADQARVPIAWRE
jgi:clan AA aspartic protease (TIGR02281 family)